ncbi:hypothetical protein [Flavobacterium pedocola]
MGHHYNKTKLICFILTFLILFESCHVYRNTSITLDQASKTNDRVKVKTTDNRRMVFRKIEKIDSTYYGSKYKNQQYKVPLKESNIREIRPVNKGLSTTLTVISITLSVLTVVVSIVVAETLNDLENINFDSSNSK